MGKALDWMQLAEAESTDCLLAASGPSTLPAPTGWGCWGSGAQAAPHSPVLAPLLLPFSLLSGSVALALGHP